MTLAEIRALTPRNIQESYALEGAAQTAELNENFKQFFSTIKEFLLELKKRPISPMETFVKDVTVKDTKDVVAQPEKKVARVPLAER